MDLLLSPLSIINNAFYKKNSIKEEINKMINKSGMKEGGNMTNLIMRPNTGNIRK
jgi:hypothetical protein